MVEPKKDINAPSTVAASSIKTDLYINGQWVKPVLGGTFDTINPANGKVIVAVANATAEDINIAVEAARAALHSEHWGYKSTGSQRAVVLRKFGKIFASRKDEIARLDCLDQGKPLREALADMGDALAAAEHFAYLAEDLDKKQYEVINNGTEDFKTEILLEPIGVIGAITPWNYPFLMGIWKVLPALAAGCTVVLKPSELAPLSCLLLAEMLTDAGLPAGVLNVVTGLGPDAGAPLSNHEGIDKISFTGSTFTARRIMSACANGPRAISLELGGKSPLIAFEDTDVNAVVDWIILGFLWGSGQVCSSTSRVLLHKSIRTAVLSRLVERVSAVKIGDSLSAEFLANDTTPAMGPVVNKLQYDKIWQFIDQAKHEGLNFLYGGDRKLVSHLGPGYFIPPTILIDVPTSSKLWKEEIFGPVLCIREFSDENEAITLANDSEYGLAAAVFSADASRCKRVTRQLRSGIVWENCCQPAFIQAPWGGVKKSGFGRELGRWGLEEFLSVKQVTGCAHAYSWGLW